MLDAGALASIGSVGDSYDNAQAESLIGLYKTEAPNSRARQAGSVELRVRASSADIRARLPFELVGPAWSGDFDRVMSPTVS